MYVTVSAFNSPAGVPVGGEELVVQSPAAGDILEILMIVGGN